MGVMATALKHLMAAGLTGDELVSAIAEIEDSQLTSVTQLQFDNRSPAAIRMARYRDRQRNLSVTKRNESVTSVTNVTKSDAPLQGGQAIPCPGNIIVTGDVTRDASPSDGFNSFPDPSLDFLTSPKENPLKGSKESPQAEKPEKEEKLRRRGTRLAEDLELPAEWQEWAAQSYPRLLRGEIFEIFAIFKDYWISKAGKDATKVDWLATWRNWLRRDKGNPVGTKYDTKSKPRTDRPNGNYTPGQHNYLADNRGFRTVVTDPNRPDGDGEL